jgi:hypothetical protein
MCVSCAQALSSIYTWLQPVGFHLIELHFDAFHPLAAA